MVTTAFHEQARLHAQSLGVGDLPLVVLPHPVGDLPPGDLEEMARAAYPLIRAALTGPPEGEPDFLVNYTLPSERGTAGIEDPEACEVCEA